MVKGRAIRELGRWLEERCQAEKLSLRQAAAKTGLSHSTISDIMKGVQPSAETIKKLANAFATNGDKERLATEDHLLVLAGYRTPRPEGDEPSELLAQLIGRLSQCSDAQLRIVRHFINFISEVETK